MSDSGVAPASTTEAVVQRIAQLRAELAMLRPRIADSSELLTHALSSAEMVDERGYLAGLEAQVEEINAQILEQARLVTEPHPLWPGGWFLERLDPPHEDLRWRTPYAPYLATPTSGAHRHAWRTREGAEAAVPTDRRHEYRAVWSPITLGEYEAPLDADTLNEVGNPRVRVRDRFAFPSGWSRSSDEPITFVVALPSAQVRDLADRYAPVLADQPALSLVPTSWLHIPLWQDRSRRFEDAPPDMTERLAARIVERYPERAGESLTALLARLSAPPEGEPWRYGSRIWDRYCALEEELRGAPLPPRPAPDSWNTVTAGPEVPREWNWSALTLVSAVRRELIDEAREKVLDDLEAHLAQQPAFDVVAGPAVADNDGVQLDLWPDEPFRELMDRCATWRESRPEPIPASWRPSLPIAYSTADAEVDLTGLHHIRQRVTWRIDELAVVTMRMDRENGRYRWNNLRRIPLRTPGGPT
ncbi:hypothetical protein ACFQ68_13250 [Amycolatopsis japonica]|uniref:hypothetical protein n=1 Tax=Amycolatopsis japonica TaxID=208439 RepID=UPI00366E1747